MSSSSVLALDVVTRFCKYRTIAQRTVALLITKDCRNGKFLAPPPPPCTSTPSPSFHTGSFTRAIQRIESPNVITVPETMRKTMEKIKEKEAEDEALRLYRRNKGNGRQRSFLSAMNPVHFRRLQLVDSSSFCPFSHNRPFDYLGRRKV